MQKSWKSPGSSLVFVLVVAIQGCGSSDIPEVTSEDAALKGGVPAGEHGKGRQGIAGAPGSKRADDDVDAGVTDGCGEGKGKGKSDTNGEPGERNEDKGGGKAGGKGQSAEHGKDVEGAAARGADEDDTDKDQGQDESSDD